MSAATTSRSIVFFALVAAFVVGFLAVGSGPSQADNEGCVWGDISPQVEQCMISCDTQLSMCNSQNSSNYFSCLAGCGGNQACEESCIDTWVAGFGACDQQHVACLGTCGC